jgi:hypothetical protein
MKSTICFLSLLALVAALVGSGCSATYQVKTKSELVQREGKGPIRALTVDSLLYTLQTFSFSDLLLSGRGTLKQHGLTAPFEGSIPFNRIVFIEGLETSYWKAVWVVPMMAGVVSGLSAIAEPPQFEIHRSGSSCPYVYAFDGTQFKLEAEAFGTSISKALEAQTFSLLPSLVPVEGSLTVRVSNERPETHLLNSVNLFAADVPESSSVVLDVDNVLWPLPHVVPPVGARDHSGKDILSDLITEDGRYWKSDLANTVPFSGFRDTLEVHFDVPPGASEATFVIHAINTELISEVYRSVGAVLGDASMLFYQALERDAELQSNIREWIRECNLRIEVAGGTNWKEVGVMPPEANVAPFSRAVRISNLGCLHGPLRVRLSSLTDVWRIDAVSMDFSPVQPLPLHPLDIMSVSASDRMNWESAIKSGDSSYALILPSNYLDISFRSDAALGMQRPVYVFAAQGYLYEWFPTKTEPASSVISETVTGGDRVSMLKLLIKQRDLILPPIYAGWRKANEMESDR